MTELKITKRITLQPDVDFEDTIELDEEEE